MKQLSWYTLFGIDAFSVTSPSFCLSFFPSTLWYVVVMFTTLWYVVVVNFFCISRTCKSVTTNY